MLRKHVGKDLLAAPAPSHAAKDIEALATVFVTSEASDHPVERLFDASGGPGGTRWVAGADGEQTLTLAFDTPQTIREVSVEAEERDLSRTQVLCVSFSEDGGRTFRERVRQEFTFSPGTTFEREVWSMPAAEVTHLRVTVKPDKGNAPGRASLTSLTIR